MGLMRQFLTNFAASIATAMAVFTAIAFLVLWAHCRIAARGDRGFDSLHDDTCDTEDD